MTSVPSSPRSRSTASRELHALGVNSVDLFDEVVLLDACSISGPSLHDLGELRPLLLVVRSQSDVKADVAVAFNLLGDFALLGRDHSSITRNALEQAAQQTIPRARPTRRSRPRTGISARRNASNCSAVASSEMRRLSPCGTGRPAVR